jgi:N-methylhydantoinase B
MAIATKSTSIDPVDAEIVRHQILAVVEEMAATMRKASGSPAITEANDFSVCILDRDGEVASFALYVTLHLGAAKECVANLLKSYPAEEIRPGDRFIVNDAYLGSAHLNDTGVLAPIFVDDELFAWAWAEAHLPDYGGYGVGGFAPGATDVYQEGLRLDLVKFIDQGETVTQVERILRNNVRMPELLMNDIRGLLAACNVCDARVRALADEKGGDYIDEVFKWSIASTESVMRERIEKLPDGTYKAEAFIEHDGVLDKYYRVYLEMTVSGSGLKFDYTGTDLQTAGFNNASAGAVWGFLLTPIMHFLAWDLPVNHGLIRPITVVLPEGTIVNAVPPAGVSGGHVDTGMHTVEPTVHQTLAQALDQSDDPELQSRASGLFHYCVQTENYFGQDNNGNPFLFFNLDCTANGGGAQSVCDGLHLAADLCQPSAQMPDVEWYEYLNPILFLFRRAWPNSGAPGRFRGGDGPEEAWTLWGAEQATGVIFGQGAEIPRAGMFGGQPSGGHTYDIFEGIKVPELFAKGEAFGNIDEVVAAAERQGAERVSPPPKSTGLRMTPNDLVFSTLGGGSGFGDALAREPWRVRDDVAKGLVTADVAERIYGVALSGGEVDEARTEELRAKILADRGEWKPLGDAAPGWGLGSQHLGGCDSCKSLIAESDWRTRALANTTVAKEYVENSGGWLMKSIAGDVSVIEYACPECKTLLDIVVDVDRAEEPA